MRRHKRIRDTRNPQEKKTLESHAFGLPSALMGVAVAQWLIIGHRRIRETIGSTMTEQKLADIAQLSFVAGAGLYIGYAFVELVLTQLSRLLAV